jgi:hypothetical protein
MPEFHQPDRIGGMIRNFRARQTARTIKAPYGVTTETDPIFAESLLRLPQ